MSDVKVSKRIFGSDGPMLRAAGNLEPGRQKLALSGDIQGGKSLDALGSTLDFGGSAGVELRLLEGNVDLGPAPPPGATEQLAPLGSFAPANGRQWSELKINGGVKVSGSGSTTSGAVTVSVSGKADLGFEYRGVRAVGEADGPEKAVKTLLANTLMPFSFGLQSFKPAQWHELSFDAALSFSAAVSAGKTLTLDSHSGPLEGLLPEDAPEVAAQISAHAKASLGLELIDSLRVGAGRLPATRPTWVRYRLERVNQRKISFSASLALELLYNREVLKSVLAAALGKVGYPEIQAQLEQIAAAIDPDALTLDNLKTKLSDELFDLAKKVLPIDETGEIAERAAGLLQLVGEVRDEYASLDGEFQGLVDHFLGSAGLAQGQSLRKALEELQGLGGESSKELVEGFTGGRFGKLEPLIELLATRGVNELLLAGGGALKKEIGRLSAESGKLLGILDKVDGSDLTDVLEKITGSTKVRQIVDFINSAPSNVADFKSFLEGKVDTELRTWVEKLAGRVTQNISQKRLDRLRQWAQKVDSALGSAASIDQRLSAEIDKLKDRVGFVASFAIDRLSRRTALVDVELDPSSQGCRRAFTSLSHGDLQEFTEKLPFETDPTGDDADEPDPPFFFHHFVLASDRSTELTWIFAPTIGAGTKRTCKAFDSSRIEIRQQPSVARSASYSGGLVLSTGAAREGLLRSWMASIWLRSQAAGSGPALSDPFDEVEHEIHLTTVRYDDEIDGTTRAGLDQLLAFLGFGTHALTSRLPAAATAAKIQAELIVAAPGAAGEPDPIDRLLAPLQRPKKSLGKSEVLDKAYLAAASGWLSEPLIRERAGDLPMNVVLPAILGSDAYRERWRNGPWDQPFVLSKGAQTLRVKPTPESPGSVFAPVLRGIASSRSWSSGPLARLGRSWAKVRDGGGAVQPSQLVDLARAFRRAVRWSTPALKFWDSPLFQHWLLFSRLDSELGKGQWTVKGVAAVSWRIGGEDWQPTQRILIPPSAS